MSQLPRLMAPDVIVIFGVSSYSDGSGWLDNRNSSIVEKVVDGGWGDEEMNGTLKKCKDERDFKWVNRWIY